MLENSATVFIYQKDNHVHFSLKEGDAAEEIVHQFPVTDGPAALALLLGRFNPEKAERGGDRWITLSKADLALLHRLTGGTEAELIAQLAVPALPGSDNLSYKAILKRVTNLWWSVEQNHNGHYLQDEHGFILTRGEWDTLFAEIQAFYLQTNDEDIHRMNLRNLGQQLPRSAA